VSEPKKGKCPMPGCEETTPIRAHGTNRGKAALCGACYSWWSRIAIISLNQERLERYLYRSKRIGARAQSMTNVGAVKDAQARGKAKRSKNHKRRAA
jgi:hypothetical protein